MRLAVFGGSRGIGARLLPQAVEREWGVKALARSSTSIPEIPGVQVVQGDVLDPGAVFRTVDGCDAVIVTLGKTKGNPPEVCSKGTAIIVPVMEKLGVRRLIVVTSMGVGESADQVPFFFKLVAKTVLRKQMQDKERQEEIVRQSGLDWTIVRPGGLTDEAASGSYRVGVDPEIRASRISREDVARVLLDQVESREWVHQAPCVTR